ncbi:MAG: HXXEE domain-containing protein [Paludibacteraceae bacterium]|nr:HXXEE domain-containing protein [Paludibacteraceae bacterium]
MHGIEGALFILLLLFIIGFITHEVEEILVQRKWMLKNEATLKQRFPMLRKVFDHLLSLDTKAFVIAVIEEFIVVALIIISISYLEKAINIYFLPIQGIFFAYTLHLLVHIFQGIIFRGYVPGLVTAILQFLIFGPFLVFYFHDIRLFLAGLAGVCILFLNLLFAHWLGRKVSSLLSKNKQND